MASNTEANRDHWNEASKTYNTQFSSTIQQIISEIQARREWIGVDWVNDSSSSSEDEISPSSKPKEPSAPKPERTVRLLDYACGTGSVSRALASSVTSCVGIDLTEGMVDVYNASALNQGIPPSEMHAVVGNLIDPSSEPPAHLSGPEFHDFDIAVVGLGFHHFDDPGLATKRLAERLKVGGVLMIVDFMPHGNHSHAHEHTHGHDHGKGKGTGGHEAQHGHSHGSADKGTVHPAAHTVTHHGFSEPEVKGMFEAAGVGKAFDYVVVGTGIVFKSKGEEKEEMKRSVFFAKGVKM